MPDPTADEINEWLDSVEPNPADVRGTLSTFGVSAPRCKHQRADKELHTAVAAERDPGDIWAVIDAALLSPRHARWKRLTHLMLREIDVGHRDLDLRVV